MSSSIGGRGENCLYSPHFTQYTGRSFKNTKEIKPSPSVAFPRNSDKLDALHCALSTGLQTPSLPMAPLSALATQASCCSLHLLRLFQPRDLHTHWFQHCGWLARSRASGPAQMSPQRDHPSLHLLWPLPALTSSDLLPPRHLTSTCNYPMCLSACLLSTLPTRK